MRITGKYYKDLSLLLFLLTISIHSYAHDVEIDGIYYNLDSENKTAEVTHKDNIVNCYSGNVKIPESIVRNGVEYAVTSIGVSAFASCSNLNSVVIPNSIIIIRWLAFDGCSGLTTVTIPNSVTSIEKSVFSDCSNLAQIKVEDGNIKYDSRNNCNAIIESSSNTLISGCKNTIIPYGISSIGSSAFARCLGLSSIEIPQSVISIESGAFSDCSGLTSIKIPYGVKTINVSAFGHCENLTSVTIPNSVTNIGEWAFGMCGLTSVTIPNSVETINGNPFSDCYNLSSIKVESGNKKFDSRNNCNAIIETSTNKLISGCKNTIIPNEIVSIGASAFEGCSDLISLAVPANVNNIGIGAFRSCVGLKSVRLPNSVSYIGGQVFMSCGELKDVVSEIKSPFSIQDEVFKGISSDAILQVPEGTKSAYQSLSGWSTYFKEIVEAKTVENFAVDGINYKVLSGNTVEVIQNPSGGSYSGNITIPSTVVYEGVQYIVTSIGNSAFANSNGLTSMSIPSSVTNIGSYAFLKCYNLASVNIPSGVTTIGEGVFYSCSSLPRVTIPNGVTTIDISAFRDCSSLTSVTIPSSVMVIQGNPFQGCTSLASIVVESGNTEYDSRNNCNAIIETSTNTLFVGCKNTVIPNSVKEVGGFTGCSSLTSITIPYGVETIGSSAFAGCVNLSSISISNSVKTIDSYAFQGCTGLTSVTIPSSVKTIGYYAFQNCSSLSLVKSEITSPFSIQNMVFKGISSNAILQVPEGTKSAYQALSGWSMYFEEIIEEIIEETFFPEPNYVDMGGGVYWAEWDVGASSPNDLGLYFGWGAMTDKPEDYVTGFTGISIAGTNYDIAHVKWGGGWRMPNFADFQELFDNCWSPVRETRMTSTGSSISGYSLTSKKTGNTIFFPAAGYYDGTEAAGVNSYVYFWTAEIDPEGTLPVLCRFIPSGPVSRPNYENIRSQIRAVYDKATSPTVTPKNAVDLGLSVKWANRNLGATSATGAGYYIAWADVAEPADGDYSKASHVHYHNGAYDDLGKTFNADDNYEWDAARKIWGSTWRVPTQKEMSELWTECTWTWTDNYSKSGVPGFIVKGPNGNSIFLPAAGWKTGASGSLQQDGRYGAYWTSSLNLGNTDYGLNLQFSANSDPSDTNANPMPGTYREFGLTIRPVCSVESISTYLLRISTSDGGSVTYDGTNITNGIQTFSVRGGYSPTLSFSPSPNYRLASLKVNDVDVTSLVSNNKYTISNITQNTTVVVTFEAIPIPTYSLGISASSGGMVTYNNVNISNGTQNFSVNEGSSVTLTFTPNTGYRLASVKVNNTDVTSQVSNNKYTISNISKNTTVEVTFQMITYSLSITSSAGGAVSYNSVKVSDGTQDFSVNSGSSATLTITPNSGYRLASLKVNNTDMTSQLSNNQYTISNISQNTTVVVTFEAIPTYSLSITVSAGGSVSYNSINVTNGSRTFSVYEGSSVTLTITPNSGFRLVSVKVNDTDVTSQVLNNQYTISNITQNAGVIVTFEEIPPLTYSLNISASVGGTVSYNSENVTEGTKTYYVNGGSSTTLTFTPNAGYRLVSVKVNNTDVTSQVSNNKYTISNISQNTTVEVTFSAITHTLTVSASGYGVVTYQGNEVRNLNRSYSVNEGVSATISFAPDEGYRIASVIVNDVDVTSEVVDNQYVVSNIKEDIWIVVTFEEKPLQIYSLTITASGDGSVSFNGESVNSETSTYSVTEGSSATLVLTPSSGYRIASVKVNDVDVTSQVSNNQYIISKISDNTTVVVTFEAIPPQTYTLNISVLGGGSVSYDDKNVTNGTQTFTVNEGSAVTLTFVPSDGYRIANVKVNDADVTSQVSNNQYTINNITANTTVVLTFEEIPIVTYSLSIAATGNGGVSYDGVTVKEQTSSFIVNEGTSATITITPGEGYRIASVKVNDVDVTTQVANNQYTISNITANTTVEVVFVEDIKALTNDGVNYAVVSYEDKTVKVSGGDYGLCLTVPTEFASNGFTWRVVGIDDDALSGSKDLAAVVWNPPVTFTARVENPNLLLYVTDSQHAPSGIQNVIVNGTADEIILTDAESGNNFYCPQEFTASSINYTHRYEMTTGFGESRGWETIALPFNVQQVSDSKGKLLPFATWQTGGDGRPFWLYELDNSGWVMTGSIKANTPYIISMPNNERYAEEYCITGNVVFSASNAKVMTTDDLKSASSGEKTFIPNFMNKDKAASLYALNVDNEFENVTGGYKEGSVFVKNLRRIHPFEAYLTVSGTNAKSVIAVFEEGTSGIRNIELLNIEGKKKVYNLSGQQIRLDENGRISHLRKGVYIIDGKKKVVK